MKDGGAAGRRLTLGAVWLWLLALQIAPVCVLLAIALAETQDGVPPFAPILARAAGGGLALHAVLDNIAALVTDDAYARALLLSVEVAAAASVACLAIGYPMALAIARAPARWQSPLLMLIMVPFWTGFLLRINAWIGLLKDDGWINTALLGLGLIRHPLHLLYTDGAMIVGITYAYLPFMILPLYATLSRLDPAMLEAAADLGATPFRAFLAVTLPLSRPGIWAGLALVFLPAVGEYIIPELLGGPRAETIGRVIWTEFFQNQDWPQAAAVALALLVLLLVPAVLVQRSRDEGS